jgi:hypothetical protein
MLSKLDVGDIIAAVWWEKDSSAALKEEILRQKRDGLRDKVFLF